MRAAVLPAIGEKVEFYEDIDVEGPGPGEVRIRTHASGVCHSDLSGQNGTLPIPLPAVLGHEGAGEIIAVGDGVTALAPGDHVIVAWVPPCGICTTCINGQPQLCMDEFIPDAVSQRFSRGGEKALRLRRSRDVRGGDGPPQHCAIKIGNDVPFDIASLIGCGVMTGVGAAINTAKVRPGSSVAVIGCGGVGISVIQGARIAGAAEIVAVDLSEERRSRPRSSARPTRQGPRVGNTEERAHVRPRLRLRVRSGRSPGDDPQRVRRDPAWRDDVVVGAGALDAMVQFSAYELFFMEKTIQGSYYGSADVRVDFERLLRLWRQGQARPGRHDHEPHRRVGSERSVRADEARRRDPLGHRVRLAESGKHRPVGPLGKKTCPFVARKIPACDRTGARAPV